MVTELTALPEHIILPHNILPKMIANNNPHFPPINIIRQLPNITSLPNQILQPPKINPLLINFLLNMLPLNITLEIFNLQFFLTDGLHCEYAPDEITGCVGGREVPA